MTLNEFLDKFPKRTRSGRGWQAPCPAHDDRNPSLSIHEREGKILVRCFAGCPTEAVLSALGLRLSDLFMDGKVNGKSRGRVEEPVRARLAVEELARAKKLPLDFLRSLGLENQSNGVRIPYKLTDGSLAKRHRIRRTLAHEDGWCYWTKGPGDIVPYGLWRLADARKAGYFILPEGIEHLDPVV